MAEATTSSSVTMAPNTLYGSSGNDRIDLSGGNDTLDGDDGDDTLRGGAGADDISGDDGNDDIDPGAGEDKVAADDHCDVFQAPGRHRLHHRLRRFRRHLPLVRDGDVGPGPVRALCGQGSFARRERQRRPDRRPAQLRKRREARVRTTTAVRVGTSVPAKLNAAALAKKGLPVSGLVLGGMRGGREPARLEKRWPRSSG